MLKFVAYARYSVCNACVQTYSMLSQVTKTKKQQQKFNARMLLDLHLIMLTVSQ